MKPLKVEEFHLHRRLLRHGFCEVDGDLVGLYWAVEVASVVAGGGGAWRSQTAALALCCPA